MKKILQFISKIQIGDLFTIIIFIVLTTYLSSILWNFPQGEYLKIDMGKQEIGSFSLNQNVTKVIEGPVGKTEVIIDSGKVRISKSPCTKKYCIHQGWINQINQSIVCVPNQIYISIIGNQTDYDSLNY
ncbi:NusG domain II-containing protein [Methylophilaceae bacterium]|nr:NusG domain II-containing protein [Methylophilaceae bacterium]MDB4138341.1 NusG domain II-containing protein [Methylophilaceae bacterium]|tara:strand:+ start:163 stop:549 length:387 start_codon:yes stop_codon:yes gene_type:complete